LALGNSACGYQIQKIYIFKFNWKIYWTTGIETPTDHNRPYCICLMKHWLGRIKKISPHYYFFLGKLNLDFPKKHSKFSISERDLNLYSLIFPKKW
jgi:hypothetical protein